MSGQPTSTRRRSAPPKPLTRSSATPQAATTPILPGRHAGSWRGWRSRHLDSREGPTSPPPILPLSCLSRSPWPRGRDSSHECCVLALSRRPLPIQSPTRRSRERLRFFTRSRRLVLRSAMSPLGQRRTGSLSKIGSHVLSRSRSGDVGRC